MKGRIVFLIVAVLVATVSVLGWFIKRHYQRSCYSKITNGQLKDYNALKLRDGDLIFQTSLSGQSKAIQLATHSKYSHCGLLFRSDTGAHNWMVLEAVQPVKYTPLREWVARGKGGHYVVKRLKAPQPTEEKMKMVKYAAEKFLNKNYDLHFDWSDEKIYCSELIWKAYYNATGVEIGKLQQLQNFDLNHPVVKERMKQRYGSKVPLAAPVISPEAVFSSDLLVTVQED